MRSINKVQARKEYYNLILKAKQKPKSLRRGSGRVERHHILPKAILPKAIFPLWSDKPENIVVLTRKEHAMAHRLLYIIYPCQATA